MVIYVHTTLSRSRRRFQQNWFRLPGFPWPRDDLPGRHRPIRVPTDGHGVRQKMSGRVDGWSGFEIAVKVASQGSTRASGRALCFSLIPRGYGWEMPALGISLKRDASAHSCSGISYDLSTGGRRCKAIMEFRALGPIELWLSGRRQDLGRARARSILAMLLLAPRALIPVETLIDRLWDTEPPPKARDSLSVYVARLRASLRQAVGDDVRLVGRAQGYLLEVDPETVDVHQFRLAAPAGGCPRGQR